MVMSNEKTNYEIIESGHKPIKAWLRGISLDVLAREQLLNLSQLPFVHPHIAVMPDAHAGKGSTIGSVIPTVSAIIPAAVGVDLGCGMMAVKTSLTANQLPDDLKPIRDAIEKAVPVGRAGHGDLKGDHPARKPVESAWKKLAPGWYKILEAHPDVDNGHVNHVAHIGSLGTGNHFIEVCLDESENVWLMLHSGSRGVGNRIGTYFIELAQKDMKKHFINLPDEDLAYFNEGAQYFNDYLHAVEWAQRFAMINRVTMMDQVEIALRKLGNLPEFTLSQLVINCHHNYVAREEHFGQKLWLTRKGAVRAQAGDWGIIPGSMGVGSYIVRGKGNPESFNSCSHGAGRLMSRNQAKKQISLEQHLKDTAGVECRKDEGIIDESPSAYKPLDAVMAAQSDLVEIVHKLRPVVCVKG